MGNISVDYDVLNQKGSPAWYSDLFANIPTPGYKGRMFISTDTFAFYRDNGVGWDLVGGPGTGTITGAGVSGQVTYFIGTDTIGGSNNLFYDITNSRLGIGTATPGAPLDIHSTGTAAQFNGTGVNNAFVLFQNAGTSKWRIGNLYNSGANDYQIYDVLNATARLTIKNTGDSTLIGTFTATSLIKSGGTSSQILLADGTTTPTSTFGAGSVTSVSALTLGTTGVDLSSSVVNSTTTPVITLNVPTASATNRGALSSADWTTFNNKQATLSLTTTGTSGAATLVGATLNIPNYTNVGTVTSVAALTLGTTGTDLSSSVANSTTTPVITLNVPTASATNRGALSTTDWTTFNNKQATISVTAPVVLTGATISMPAATTSVSGYLTSTDWNTFNNKTSNLGTVTDVVALTIGTTGIDITSTAVTTTTTPVITLNIPTASALNRGALSSTDWTTFNNKQSALTNPVTGTGTTNTLPKFTAASTIGNSNITDTGSLITLSSNTQISSGAFGIANSSLTGYTIRLSKNITGSTSSFVIRNEGVVQSDVTSDAIGFRNESNTAAASFTLTNYWHFWARQGTIGASSVITNQHAFYVDSNMIGATNNYGFRGAIPSGTNRWNIYMDGTAANYMAGQTGVGTATLGSYIFNVGGSVATLVNFNSTNASGFYTTYSTSGTERAYIGLGANTITGLAISDFGIVGSANIVFASGSGGTETMRIDSSKNIGMRTTTIGSTLQINGNAAIGYSASTAAPTNGLQVAQNTYLAASSGTVSIGITPQTDKLFVYNASGTNSGLSIQQDGTGDIFRANGNSGANRFVITQSGAATFSSTLGINGTSDNIKSGTYTPTVTASTNCAAVTAFTCQYLRVGSVVTVSGKVYGSATATNTETQFNMTVPVNSNFASVEQCGGTGRSAEGGVAPSGAGYVAFVNALSANTVRFSYTAPAVLGTGGNFWFSFTYLIV